MSNGSKKRLFFAFHVEAPWPDKLPFGRLLEPNERHMTLAFLGEADLESLLVDLKNFPKPLFQIGFAGHFDKALFLPPRQPRVVAWNGELGEQKKTLSEYQHHLVKWLQEQKFPPIGEDRPWLPHTTLCRAPFDSSKWKTSFRPLPFISSRIHLYESIGNLRYEPRWTYELLAPFEERCEKAYLVRGKNLTELMHHAGIALAFRFPPILEFFDSINTPTSAEAIISYLNFAIAQADTKWGCPLKSVSFHGNIVEKEDKTLEWEIIV